MQQTEDDFIQLQQQSLSSDDESSTPKVKKPMIAMKSDPGVIYLGRIPHGFYEEEMESYFSQFGQVCRLRLARNRKTGKSKHYAFIEFASKEVAKVVAETMDNYLLFNHQLQCKVLDQVHEELFKGANRKFKKIPWKRIAIEKHNKPKTEEKKQQLLESKIKKRQEKRLKLQELGIDYDFPISH
jgi:nucleolar protein 15